MAEARISITAHDRATAILQNVKSAFDSLNGSIQALTAPLWSDNSIDGVIKKLWSLKEALTSAFSKPQASPVLSILAEIATVISGIVAGVALGLQMSDKSTKEFKSAVEEINKSIAELSRKLPEAFGRLKTSLDDLSNTLKQHPILSGKMEREFKLNTAGAISALRELKSAIDKIPSPIERVFKVNAYDALLSIASVKSALDSIPDIIYKTVVIQYKTQASPVMPFSEGMEMVRKKMESLPALTTHTVRYSRESGNGHAGAGFVNFSPTIVIKDSSGGGEALARQIDRELADMWRHGRSELGRTVKGAA
jgi:hypothetical protein